MPLDATTRADALNDRYRHHAATDVLRHALTDPEVGQIAMVSSFGAESVALLHMLSVVDPDVTVLFLETGMLFPETLDYQTRVAEELALTDVRRVRPDPTDLATSDPQGLRHKSDPDGCCHLRKVAPLARAIEPFDGWITGRKRFQGGQRAALQFFEAEGSRIKVNPLAHWAPQDVRDYIENNDLPRHPLVAQGFPSIGCAPCTTRVAAGEDPRAGRWRGQEKEECGIHFENGRAVRGPVKEAS